MKLLSHHIFSFLLHSRSFSTCHSRLFNLCLLWQHRYNMLTLWIQTAFPLLWNYMPSFLLCALKATTPCQPKHTAGQIGTQGRKLQFKRFSKPKTLANCVQRLKASNQHLLSCPTHPFKCILWFIFFNPSFKLQDQIVLTQ